MTSINQDEPGAPAAVHLVSLSEDVLVESEEGGRSIVVVSRWGELTMNDPPVLVRELLHRMSLGPVSLENVTAGPAAHGSDDVAGVRRVLHDLSGSIVHSVGLRDLRGPLLSAVPCVSAPVLRFPTLEAQPVRLSRFATTRTCAGELSVESPDAQFRVLLHQPVAAKIASVLATPRTIAEIAAVVGTSASVVGEVVRYLVAAGVVLAGTDHDGFAEDADPARRLWTHHELTFHQRSRSRNRDTPGDSAVPGEPAAAPVTKPVPGGKRLPLYRPDLGVVADASLTSLLEADHGCPDFSARALTAAQLGELLFRAARVRGPGPRHLPHGMTHAASQRPYLSVACLYELELYLSVERCDDVPRGVYHYDPADHALTLVNDDENAVTGLLDMAKVAAGCVLRPPAMISMTARMARLAVLGGAAYATTLMHAGALQQTLSLVAKAMGLAAHPVPVDADDTVARAFKLPWPAEVGVGECVIDCPN